MTQYGLSLLIYPVLDFDQGIDWLQLAFNDSGRIGDRFFGYDTDTGYEKSMSIFGPRFSTRQFCLLYLSLDNAVYILFLPQALAPDSMMTLIKSRY